MSSFSFSFSLVSRLPTCRTGPCVWASPLPGWGPGRRGVRGIERPEVGRCAGGPGTVSCRVGRWGGLLADPEALDGLAVALDVLPLQIIEQAPPLAHQLEQTATAVMVLAVR